LPFSCPDHFMAFLVAGVLKCLIWVWFRNYNF
jgi:hypothetical protein